jgi:hypothetical protein
MDEKLKEELLSFFTNMNHTMRAYMMSITSRQYIDPASHLRNIEKMNILLSELKKKVEKS